MSLPHRTRLNRILDANVFVTALVATITGIYFLYLPIGGYQGGRDPMYGLIVLFKRATWDDLHTWSGVLMIIAGFMHLLYHWNWVRMMAKRVAQSIGGIPVKMSAGAQINVVINVIIGLGFLLSSVSGVYFLFQPRVMSTLSALNLTGIFLTSNTWDAVHTWSSVIMILAAMAHFVIHWGWIDKVTRGIFHV